MRTSRTTLLVAAVGVLLALVSCSRQVTGVAQPDPAAAPLAVADDGYGIVAGFDDAPARIEIFTEPQCTHCADLQHDFGDQLAHYIDIGLLQVTYRPLTFLDISGGDEGYSATVANAMFLAAEPPVSGTGASGTQFQRFVEELWANQDPGGPAFTSDELQSMAEAAGLPEPTVDAVIDGGQAVDVVDMDDANFASLYDIDPTQTGTPTVYDLEGDDKIDIYDDNWLDKLVAS
ncbi:thioredoxin domain-containing protein [Mycobacterium sp. Y57]|uniref:DsbA family protein n=1 Tax=Mycolicibacterium xanthum TaxID=2796469 RepID=UPI001C8650CD|nr:thioredoxin domain-containing protein [Mycolicibacterium xanthum]MBX7435389.1 thioredoxin domain-containing protein [Mycolicibacterium xanthum]